MIPQPWTQCYNRKALLAALNFRMGLTRACNDTSALDAMLQSKSTRGSFEFSHGFNKGLQ